MPSRQGTGQHHLTPGGGLGVLPYIGYIRRCGPKGYAFSVVLVIYGISILAIFVLNRVWFLYSSLELGMLFRRSYFFIIIKKTINKTPLKTMCRATVSVAMVINRVLNFRSGLVIYRVGKITDFGHK